MIFFELITSHCFFPKSVLNRILMFRIIRNNLIIINRRAMKTPHRLEFLFVPFHEYIFRLTIKIHLRLSMWLYHLKIIFNSKFLIIMSLIIIIIPIKIFKYIIKTRTTNINRSFQIPSFFFYYSMSPQNIFFV